MVNEERLKPLGVVDEHTEEIISILSSLAIEGIFLPADALKKMLGEVGLSLKLTENLVTMFGKNGGKNGDEK